MLLFAESWPTHVYKYTSASRAAEIIRNLQLYMAPVSQLNDLYDLNIIGFWQEDDETKFRIFAKRIMVQTITSEFDNALALAKQMNVESVVKEYKEWLTDNAPIFDQIIQNSGVTCFTSQGNNQRMWGTYGANHSGVVIEFDTDVCKWPMSKSLKPVIYTDQRLPICPSRLIDIEKETGRPLLAQKVIEMLLCAKHIDWRDEMEWRLLMLSNDSIASSNRLVSFPRSAISHVFIAPRITLSHEQTVRTAARNHDPPIPVIKRVPHREDQHEHYEGAEIITDYSQLEYWMKQREKTPEGVEPIGGATMIQRLLG
jgi:hypothetical protein